VVCAIAATAVFVLFAVVGTLLTGEGPFRRSDQIAMIGLGVVFAIGIMMIARPRVQADEHGVKVRNIIGGYELPWQVVRKVSFDRGRPWLSLELENDDTVSVLAVQAADKEHAVRAVRELRELHAEQRR
jgi:hypothetical protein